MKTTLWVQIVQKFMQNDELKESMEVKAFAGDTWAEAFQLATADYLATGSYFVATDSVKWFKMQIINELFAVEQGMKMEWTRPETQPEPEPEPEPSEE